MRAILLFLIFSMVGNCASYWENRRKDAADVITIGAETPVYGAGVRIFFLPLGFFFAGGETEPGKRDKGFGFGVRGGDLGSYRSQQLVLGLGGGEMFAAGEVMTQDDGSPLLDKQKIPVLLEPRSNLKSHNMRYLSFVRDPAKDRIARKQLQTKRAIAEALVKQTGREELLESLPQPEEKPFGYPNSFSYQTEAFVGLYGGLRVGVNWAELLDLILGFTSYDLLEDDMSSED